MELAPDALALARLALRWFGYAALLGGAGAILFFLAFPRSSVAGFAARLSAIGGLLALLTIPPRLQLEVVFLGGGWAASADLELWRLVLTTPAGQALLVQAAGLLLLILGVALPGLRWPGGVGGGLLALVGIAWVGHAADLAPAWPAQLLLVLHLAGLAFWLGSLWPLLRVAGAADGADVMERFSRLATWTVAALLLAGFALAAWLVGGFAALVSSPYGQLLLAKLAAVATLLALAAANKWRLVPALRAGRPGAVAALARSIRTEIAIVVLVLGVTAALTTLTGPPT
ncbi:hypothetical protein AY599_03930 [Leptolyngbya valderiana BDU 20041]|nr:hypothetical protein AY599_03930 [Leptolyngbya valderiana BDU 20041]